MLPRKRRLLDGAAFWRPRRRVGALGWAYVGLVLFLLFYPFRTGGAPSLWKELLPYGLHAGMWVGLVWSLWPLAGGRRGRQWLLLAVLVVAGGASEVAQGWVGRTPEWQDWGMDTLGAAGAFLYGRGWRRTGIALGVGAAAALLAVAGIRWNEERLAHPVLADCAQRWSRYRWECNGTRLWCGKKCFRLSRNQEAPGGYPGAFRFPLRHDWTGSRGIELRLYWPKRNGGPGTMGVRVDDRPGNPPYGDRWQAEFGVTNGWNTVVLDRDWLATPDGRRMDARRILAWGVFVVDSPRTNYFGLAGARLLME